jgi:hypothetical protein
MNFRMIVKSHPIMIPARFGVAKGLGPVGECEIGGDQQRPIWPSSDSVLPGAMFSMACPLMSISALQIA